jgi:hypothetical protein
VDARTDGELVSACLGGERAAFGVLIDRHRGQVVALTRRMLGNAQDVEDVSQEAFLAAFLGLDRLRDPERFASWVSGIALNLARMRLRERREPLTLDGLAGGRVVPGPVALEPSPEQALEELEALAALRHALEPLPPRERDVVLMHYVDGLTSEEIAALLDERAGTVRVRLHRARARLRRRLSPTRRELEPMIEVTLEDVVVRVLAGDAVGDSPRLANQRLRVVLLKDREGDRILPIWVGPSEGDALALHLGGESAPRPLTADLMARLLEAAGARVERVAVHSLREKTFYATVTLRVGVSAQEIDARPSDALNLAARVGAPMFVDRELMESSGIAAEDAGYRLLALEREWHAQEGSGEEPEGEWRSLTPELVKSIWGPPPGRT